MVEQNQITSVLYGEKVSWGSFDCVSSEYVIVASRHGRRSDTVAVAGTGGDPVDFSCGDWLLLLPDARDTLPLGRGHTMRQSGLTKPNLLSLSLRSDPLDRPCASHSKH